MPIFDQGYQHWSGRLSAPIWRWLAITRHGVRVGLGSRMLRYFLLMAWLPALLLIVVLCLWGMVERKSETVSAFAPIFEFLIGSAVRLEPRLYRVEVWTICFSCFLSLELSIAMVLVLLVGPDLISQDLRYNALPLYFSRPLSRLDYFLGKLGIPVVFVGLVIVVPSVIAYLLGLAFSLDYTILRDTYRVLLASVAYGLFIALSAGLLVLALSSLSRNSRYVALFWLCVWIVSGVVTFILNAVDYQQHWQQVIATEGVPQRFRNRAVQQRLNEAVTAEIHKAANTNWRPLASYRANLKRIGDQLLGTNACVEKLGTLQPPQLRNQFLANLKGYEYPWQWSAAVLAALFGLSACILTFSIKSLDRLK